MVDSLVGRVQEEKRGHVHTVLSSGPGSPVWSLKTDLGGTGLCEPDSAPVPVTPTGCLHIIAPRMTASRWPHPSSCPAPRPEGKEQPQEQWGACWSP